MTDRVSCRARCSGAGCLPRPYPARPLSIPGFRDWLDKGDSIPLRF